MGQAKPIRSTPTRPMSPLEVAAYRRRIEDQIEQLIATLDELDGDTDLEPTMGGVNPFYGDEAEEDGDGEPSLGWTVTYALGSYIDEWGGDREEDMADHEPSLGFPERIDQSGPAGDGDDAEWNDGCFCGCL